MDRDLNFENEPGADDMTLDDVAPDTITVLTKKLERLFRYAGCRPACHACHESIKIGEKFQLATCKPADAIHPEPRDVMLCETCTVQDLIAEEKRAHKAWRRRGGGFSRPSQRCLSQQSN